MRQRERGRATHSMRNTWRRPRVTGLYTPRPLAVTRRRWLWKGRWLRKSALRLLGVRRDPGQRQELRRRLGLNRTPLLRNTLRLSNTPHRCSTPHRGNTSRLSNTPHRSSTLHLSNMLHLSNALHRGSTPRLSNTLHLSNTQHRSSTLRLRKRPLPRRGPSHGACSAEARFLKTEAHGQPWAFVGRAPFCQRREVTHERKWTFWTPSQQDAAKHGACCCSIAGFNRSRWVVSFAVRGS